MLKRIHTILYSKFISFFLKKSGLKFRIDPRLNSYQELKNISIGDNFRSMGVLQLFAGNGQIDIGNNCSFNINVQIGASDGIIEIANDVLIGPNCVLRSSIHNFHKKNININEQGHKSGKIKIENNVWISSNCVISGNVTIGEGSIIGACSFVNKDVEPNSIYAGNPAKKIYTK